HPGRRALAPRRRAARLPPRALPRRRPTRRRGAGDAAPIPRRRPTHGPGRSAGGRGRRHQRPPAQHRRHAGRDLPRARAAGRAGPGDGRRRPPGRLAGARPGAAGRQPPDPPARAVQRRDAGSPGPRGGLTGAKNAPSRELLPPPQRGGALGWGVYPPPRSSTAPPRASQPPAAARREEPATPARAARRRRPNAPSRPNSARVQPPTAMLNGSGCYREPTSRPMTDAPNDSIAVRLDAVRLDRGPRTILSGVDLSVPRGSVTAVLGPSGSGKSTLLAALTGELVPASGTVEVFGQPVPRRMRELLALRKSIGVLLQGNGLLTDLTAAENV